MKKFLALLLAATICFTLASCNVETGGGESSEPASTPESSAPASTPDSSTPASTPDSSTPESSAPDSSTPDSSVPEEDDERLVDEKMAAFYANESGFSILTVNGKRYCVNSKGYATYELPKGEVNVTNVYNGVFLTYDGSKVHIRKTNGEDVKIVGYATTLKILFATDAKYYDEDTNDDFSNLVNENELVDSLFRDGYILAVKLLESSTGYRRQMGVISIDGTWKHNLSFDNPLSTAIGMTDFGSWYNLAEIFGNINYCGEGILKVYGNFGGKMVKINYDVEKNVAYQLTGKHLRDVVPTFKNGVYLEEIVTPHNMSVGTYILYANGGDGGLSALPAGSTVLSFNPSNVSGVAIYSSYNAQAGKNYYNVCNIRGNTIKSFEAYDMADINSINETYAQLLIYNADGSYSYTKMDMNGNFLFNPVKITKTAFAVSDTDGNIVLSYGMEGSSAPYGTLIVIDDNGNKIGEYKNADINNGIVKAGKEFIKIK